MFKKTFNNLNSFLLPVVLSYILEPKILSSFFAKTTRESVLGTLGLFLLFILRVYFYSGMYGCLIEFITGEEISLKNRKFVNNVKSFWKLYLFCAVLPIIIHFLLYLFIPSINISVLFITSILDVPVLYIISKKILFEKYLSPGSLQRKKILVQFSEGCIVVGLFVLNIASYILASSLEGDNFYQYRLTLFFIRYLHFLIFLYLSSLIINRYPEVINKFKSEKELYLINPLAEGVLMAVGSLCLRTYPAIFIVLKAFTPKNYKIREFNRIFWRRKYVKSNKLVAITCFSSNTPEAYRIAKSFQQKGSKVVMGGCHVTFFPDEALEYCDSVVIGDAEGAWEKVIEDYENGCLKEKYIGYRDEAGRRKVHEELMSSSPAIVKDYIESSRGCKFKCEFCAISSLLGDKICKKPVEEIVELLRKVKEKYRSVTFIDNNIYADPSYTKELLEAIKPVGILWAASTSIDIAKNDEMLQLAKDSGCVNLLIGYEISDKSYEKEKGGKLAMADQYRILTKKIKKKGISVKGHFIFGFDDDSYKSLFSLWKFCFLLSPFITVVSLLTPLPGSKFYSQLLKEKRLKNLSWRNYSLTSMVFEHKNMNSGIIGRMYPLIMIFFLVSSSLGGLMLFCLWFYVDHVF